MITGLLTALLSSFFGTLGFGILLKAPRRSLGWASAIGAAGYGAYWLVLFYGGSDLLGMFIGALIASLLAQWAARKLKMIVTVFITPAIIPLVPGLGLYQCMSYLAQGQSALGGQTGIHAMMNVLMIALGIGLGSIWPHRRHKHT
ncbi:MAG: threonine/serine exporter family protein [Clostridia bacterium]|nr:threonine/serine exporter family protein [Clostridia bacterium]